MRRLVFLLALVLLVPAPVRAQAVPRTATPIMGRPVLTAEQLTAWFQDSGRTPRIPIPVGELANLFVVEGLAEGVRGDVAFAQAVLETDYFMFTGSVPPETNNYGGQGATGGEHKEISAFPDPATGVRAMIQHLRAYADPTVELTGTTNPLVDDRFHLVNPKGKAPTFESLNQKWATGKQYGQRVLLLYQRILAHAGVSADDPAPFPGLPAPISERDVVGMASDPGGGMVFVTRDGDVVATGGAADRGSVVDDLPAPMRKHVVAVEGTPLGDGYVVADVEGGISVFGTATFSGSVGRLVARGDAEPVPIVDLALTPTGNGYYVLGADGSVFALGDAVDHGSLPLTDAVAIDTTPLGDGYVVVTRDGGVHAFGGATFSGSVPGLVRQGLAPAAVEAVDITTTASGYLVADEAGGVYAFGDARYEGGLADREIDGDVIAIEPIALTGGYRLVTDKGTSFAYV